jgi:AraC family transcriptional regulator
LDEEITIADVADHCHLSKYYFSRVFKAETCESLYAFIKRLKMEQSALRLKIEKDKSITSIGFNYGYDSANFRTIQNSKRISVAGFLNVPSQTVAETHHERVC